MAFENLDPNQKKILAIGAPVVAVFALISVLQKRNAPAQQAAPTAPTGWLPPSTPSTSAIGVGQLSEFESILTNAVNNVGTNVQKTNTTVTTVSDAVKTVATKVADVQTQLTAVAQNQNTQTQKIVTPVAAPVLPKINSADYPVIGLPGQQMAVLGTVNAGNYSGQNVQGGAPVYAFVSGQWVQNFDSKTLPNGTPLATPSNFSQYIV